MKRKPLAAMVVALAGLAVAVPESAASPGVHTSDGFHAAAAHSSYVDFKAGYTATTLPNKLTTASATIILPELSCTEDTQAISLGLGSEPKFGKFRYLAVVHTACQGRATYFLNAHVRGHRRGNRIVSQSGHKIRVAITRTASGSVKAMVKDVDTGLRVKQSGTLRPSRHDDEIDFGAFPLFLYGDLVEVPEFQPVSVTKAKVGDDSGVVCIGETGPVTNVRKDQYTGEVEISPGPLSACDFSLNFESH